jgi:glycosyltransferase involved in cell wall biosynthesis
MSTPATRAAVPLSVVMPAYNEEGAIAAAVAEVCTHVLDRVSAAELIVVNDGSRDQTGAILDQIAAGDARVRVVHQKNGGHGAALMTGLANATGERVFLIDSDRQIPLDTFPRLWQALEGGRAAAFGVRRVRHDPALRLGLTRMVRSSLRVLFGVRLSDANVPFKLLPRSLWQEARPLIPDGTLAPSLLLAVFAARRGVDIAEVDVPHRERATGVVSIRRWRLLKFCSRALAQLLVFRRQLK